MTHFFAVLEDDPRTPAPGYKDTTDEHLCKLARDEDALALKATKEGRPWDKEIHEYRARGYREASKARFTAPAPPMPAPEPIRLSVSDFVLIVLVIFIPAFELFLSIR